MKKSFVVFLAVIAFIFLAYYYYNNPAKKQNVQPIVAAKTITVQQKINNGSYATIQIVEGKTALELLQKTAQVKMTGQGVNAFVTEINNVKADSSKKQYWAFYVNGKLSDVGAGSYKLKVGDKIEWRIESY